MRKNLKEARQKAGTASGYYACILERRASCNT